MKRFVCVFLWILTAFSITGYGESVRITRAPYLQEMSNHAVLVAWRTSLATPGEVAVKTVTNSHPPKIFFHDLQITRLHAVWLRNLQQNTAYEYKILAGNQALTDWISFKTFPDSGNEPFSFAVLGDSGTNSFQQKAVAKQLARAHPDLILHTGDVIYNPRTGSDFDYDLKFFSIYRSLAEHIPFFPSLGNHDVVWENGNPYLRNFYLPQNSPGKGRYYSFNCVNVHFVALNSNESMSPVSPQYEWLVQDLENSSLPIRIIYFHHPLYSSGYHGSSESLRKSLVPILEHFHVTLVFNGHDHDYERSVPIHGITYVVSGGGGAILYPPGRESWTAFSQAIYHMVLCKVAGNKIHLEAINDDGNVFDSADFRTSNQDTELEKAIP